MSYSTQDYAKTMYQLGRDYQRNHNTVKALQCFQKAAKWGNQDAQISLDQALDRAIRMNYAYWPYNFFRPN
jgi:hypothetical protein